MLAKDRKAYKTAINSLGANILRSGLAAAMADLERQQGRGMLLREHLAASEVPGLTGPDVNKETLPSKVRALAVDDYMLATAAARYSLGLTSAVRSDNPISG